MLERSLGLNRYSVLTLVFLYLMLSGDIYGKSTASLRVLATTDIHMHINNFDYYADKTTNAYGLAKVASLVQQARAEIPNTILVDNGDLIQGNPLGDFAAYRMSINAQNPHPAFKAMNLMAYDVGNIGNHEFNYGLDFLLSAVAGAQFPYISSNVYWDDKDDIDANDKHVFKPYHLQTLKIVDNDGLAHLIKVGYVGFVPPQIMRWDFNKLNGKVKAKDIVESAKAMVPELKSKGADIIIAIPHSGMRSGKQQPNEENASYFLSLVKGIDAIVFGHSHSVFPGDKKIESFEGVDSSKGQVNGVAAVMPGFWGSHLGIIDLQLIKESGRWRVIDSKSSVRPIFKRIGEQVVSLVSPNSAISKAIELEHQATRSFMKEKVAATTDHINSFFAQVQDDPSVQIVNDAQIWYAKSIVRGTELENLPLLSAASPLKAGGRGGPEYYTEIKQGELKLRHVSDLYIYPNDLKIVKLTGQQIIDWLERSAGQFNQINPNIDKPQQLINSLFRSYNFEVIDGISYQIDVTQPSRFSVEGLLINPKANRIKQVKYQGERINLEQAFLVVTNNYRATGGGNFPNLDGSTVVIDAPDKNRDVIAKYLMSKSVIKPMADNNWTFSSFGDARVVFKTSPKAQQFINEKFEYLKTLDDGFGLFEFK